MKRGDQADGHDKGKMVEADDRVTDPGQKSLHEILWCHSAERVVGEGRTGAGECDGCCCCENSVHLTSPDELHGSVLMRGGVSRTAQSQFA